MMSGNAPAVISVDGGKGEIVQTAPPDGGSGRTQKLTWRKTELSDGEHTVVVRHAGGAGYLTGVGFFMYMPGSGSGGSSSSNSPTKTKPIPVGAIVGGVIGSVVVLALLTLFLCIRARDRRVPRDQKRQQMHQAYLWPVYPAEESFVEEG
ncbi:hypothetical protein FRC08_017262 [Ceratobasidium sp. 394]|nr:hypothetical protein FRC08_017262 [Ceratobasidium sp. 394]